MEAVIDVQEKLKEKGQKIIGEFEENGRYVSWQHCNLTFKKCKEKINESNKECVIDYLALHLAFYLASWGMYRGSSFLLQYDYKIHERAVEHILNPEYEKLWDITIENIDKLDKEEIKSKLASVTEQLMDTYKKYKQETLNKILKPEYGITIENIDELDKEKIKSVTEQEENITDTLVTKILLGTFGCVPAYDRYVVSALKRIGIKETKFIKKHKLNEKAFDEVWKFCVKSKTTLKEVYNSFKKLPEGLNHKKYPIMKILDISLWQYGIDLENTIIFMSNGEAPEKYSEDIDRIKKELKEKLVNQIKDKPKDLRLQKKCNRIENIEVEYERKSRSITGVQCLLIVTDKDMNMRRKENICNENEIKNKLEEIFKIK